MKYYGLVAVIGLLSACPQMRGAPGPRTFRIETVAGSSANGDRGPATAAQISSIQGLAMDRFGNLYLSDTDNHRVRRISATGIITTVAGTGIAGFNGDGGPATSAQLNLPYGLAVDYDGNLYIADLGNQRVRRVSPDGTITTIAGDGRKLASLDGGAASQASLLSPRNLAVDDAGTLYISEFEGHRVRKITTDGKISSVAGTGQAGYRGDGLAATGALLSYPAGLALDRSGSLYIADSGNGRIRKIYSSGLIGTVLGGSTSTPLVGPIAVTVDSLGTIYTADSSFVVRAFTIGGKWIDFAGIGAPAYAGDGAAAAKASLTAVHELLASRYSTSVYIADGVRVRSVDMAGVIRTYAGDGFMHSVGDGLAPTQAILNQPSAVALDSKGSLFIADTGTQRVRQIWQNGSIATAAGTGTAALGADGPAATNSPLNFPMGVAVDAAGNLLIADTYNHRVRQVAWDGRVRTIVGTGSSGMGVDGAMPATVALRAPRGICTDRTGTLYVVDSSNHRVLRIPAGGVAQTVAGNGSPGDGGDGGQSNMAQLNQPAACHVDSYGSLYIADTLNHRIRKVSASGIISTVAGTAAGFSGDEAAAIFAQLSAPLGIAADDAGNLYVADTGNHRIRMVTTDGVIHSIAGIGTAAYSGDKGPAAQAQLNAPAGLVLDGSGALYFADSGNHRVRRLVPEDAPPAPDPIPQVVALAVANALSLQTGPVAPGEIVSIFGAGLGPESGVAGGTDASGLVSNLVAGVEVRFDNVPAPLFYVQNQQINTQAPYTIAGAAGTHVEVRLQGKIVGTADLPVAAASPALLPLISNQDGSPNGESAPAPPGTVLTLFATGEGLTDGANIAGRPATVPLPRPLLPVSITIAGVPVDLLYAGSAPGLAGMMQINARVPGGFLTPGRTEVALTIGGIVAPTVPLWLK
jgi:uncharacterized protein (TIGR03437 family)